MCISILFVTCTSDDQQIVNDLEGTWQIDTIIYVDINDEDSIVTGNLMSTLSFTDCDIKEQSNRSCPATFVAPTVSTMDMPEQINVTYNIQDRGIPPYISVVDVDGFPDRTHPVIQGLWDITILTDNELGLEQENPRQVRRIHGHR